MTGTTTTTTATTAMRCSLSDSDGASSFTYYFITTLQSIHATGNKLQVIDCVEVTPIIVIGLAKTRKLTRSRATTVDKD